jgi:amino acid adenylation domain-containing protein
LSGAHKQFPEGSLADKRSRLAELLQEEAGPDTLPLSFAQQRLWFLTQLEPDNPSYNIPQALRLKGALDLDALQQTINAIVDRHEALRTTFRLVNGEPVQLVSTRCDTAVALIDLGGLAPEQRETESKRLRMAEARQPFDLARDFPLRATLLRLGPDDYQLLLTIHHIVSDGWSMGILTKELSTIYEALTTGQAIELPDLPIQYADFAEWQREWLQGEVLSEQLSFWKEALAGAPAVLSLPTDRPRPAVQSFRGSHIKFALSKQLSQSLVALSRSENATLFMTLLAAFQILLLRYTEQEDIVVGTPIAGRNRVETEGLIGFFVNTLVLRTDLSGRPTFREVLARVKETALGAYAHQDLPFEKLVEEMNPVRDVSHTALFQVMFILQNAPRESISLGNLSVSRLAATSQTAKFDLTVQMSEEADGLACWFEYNTDLFDEGTIARMCRHFEVLLEGIVASPDSRLSDFPLLTPAELQQLVEWNKSDVEYQNDHCLHELFEEQVRATPNRIAVISPGEDLSFADLNERANQLAHFLRKQGVGPEVRVAICVERSPEMVVGVLGVLKAGGAFVPIDPSYPTERVSFLIQDSRAPILLTQQRLLGSLPASESTTIALDSDWQRIAQESTENPGRVVAPENAAYVIYTSGSTGKPKGSVSPHCASLNRFHWMWRSFPFAADDVCCQKTSLSFVDSVWEIFGPLLKGVPLVIIHEIAVRDPQLLIDTLSVNRVTRLVLVPSLLRVMLDQPGSIARSLPSLKHWTSSGEVLPVDLARSLKRKLPDSVLINLYGSSEIAADVTCFEVAEPEKLNTIPIGRPISNTAAYVLDDQLQPVPVGVHGEIYIAGAGLARCYLDHGDLTAERFLPDRRASKPGARMFRTGDRARYREDGTIEYLGRSDFQVKIRGYRVELGEIETVLKAHPAVNVAVAVLVQLTSENQGLVGYVVPSSRRATEFGQLADELKDFLRQKLPEYMVPGAFVFLNALPLTPSGKIDRRALPPPEGIRAAEGGHVAPRDDLEKRLADIWEGLLGVKPIGVTDNFFELGGHSLLAVKLVSEIERDFGQRIRLVSLFQNATVELLGAILRRGANSIVWPTLVEIQTGRRGSLPLFCVSTPNVNALGYRSLARHLGPDQSVYGLQAQYPEDLQGEHSHAAVDKLANDYLEAMREVQSQGPYQLVGFCRGAQIAHEMARSLQQTGQAVTMLGVLDTWVLENTYNKFLYVGYYYRRIRSLLRHGLKEALAFIRDKAKQPRMPSRERLGSSQLASFLIEPARGAVRLKNPMREVYFPGTSFVPRIYPGKITVFRVRRQPLNRIRDAQLGWGKLAGAGVDVHFIPGKHDTVLREPNVQGLAAELRKCLLANQADADLG